MRGCTSKASDGASEKGTSRLHCRICSYRNDCGIASAMATSIGSASSTPTTAAAANRGKARAYITRAYTIANAAMCSAVSGCPPKTTIGTTDAANANRAGVRFSASKSIA